MAFNFGTTSTFGTQPTSSFGFGTSNPTTKATTAFGTSNFSFGSPAATTSTFGLGSTATTTTSTGFGAFGSTFGTPATTQSSVFGGFGASGASTATFSGFGTSAQTTNTGGLFSGFGTATTTSAPSLFNISQPQQSTGFGAFGTKPFGTTTTPSVGFNLGGGLNTGLGQQQQQQQQQQAPSELEQLCHSLYNVYIFGDERDGIISKLNLLQACWGKGKGFYAPNVLPVEYTPTNSFHRFKTVVYSVKPTAEARDGFVILQFNKKEEEIRAQEEQLKASLTNVLGNKPNLILHVDSIKAASETSSLVFLYVEERAQNGQTRRITNTELCSFLLQPTTKSQLLSMGVVDVYTFTMPDKDQIQEYLHNPPAGIDQLVWKQALADNPDSQKYIPVPILGFCELKWRYNCQFEETKRHQAYLEQLSQDIVSLRNENENIRLKILDFKQKHNELQHRLLKLMVKQQVYLNVGIALRPEEEILRSQLDNIEAQLNSTQLAGKLSELSTQVRLHKQEESQQDPDSYNMVPVMQQEMKQFLSMQQDAIKSLIEIIQEDMTDLKIIEADLTNVHIVKDQ